jgi:hypothetical protein
MNVAPRSIACYAGISSGDLYGCGDRRGDVQIDVERLKDDHKPVTRFSVAQLGDARYRATPLRIFVSDGFTRFLNRETDSFRLWRSSRRPKDG